MDKERPQQSERYSDSDCMEKRTPDLSDTQKREYGEKCRWKYSSFVERYALKLS